LILAGLPAGTNLQESFLLTRLAASSLLRDRMITRFTQGVGRCTRSDRDFAAVMLLDRSLIDFIIRTENRRTLHPELQAELQFGMENSQDKSTEDFVALTTALIEQGEEWSYAERAISNLRSKKAKQEDQVAEKLRSVVGEEVDFVYALWSGDLEKALERARTVSDRLGGNETKGYRGWWYYLAADTATQIFESTKSTGSLQIAKKYYGNAASCSLSISWFAELARLKVDGVEVASADELTPLCVKKVRQTLIELGLTGQRFEQHAANLLAELESNDHDTFQHGLELLGPLLGFESHVPNSTADPDCVWSLGDRLHISHEVKVEHTPSGEIGANDVRQAASHVNWIKAHVRCRDDCEIVCTIESPREIIETAAIAHAKGLFYVNPTAIRDLATEAVSIIRAVRAASDSETDESLLERIREEMATHSLLPRDIQKRLMDRPCGDLS
jgi:hypothetical protein